MTKVCTKCKLEKPLSEFYKEVGHRDGRRSACKQCAKLAEHQYWVNNPDKKKLKSNKYSAAHRTKKREYDKHYSKTDKSKRTQLNCHYKRNYDLTLGQVNEMFVKQKGCCAICGIHYSELHRRLDIDHNHITGNVRGLLCHKCNVLMGMVLADSGEALDILCSAISYLKNNGVSGA